MAYSNDFNPDAFKSVVGRAPSDDESNYYGNAGSGWLDEVKRNTPGYSDPAPPASVAPGATSTWDPGKFQQVVGRAPTDTETQYYSNAGAGWLDEVKRNTPSGSPPPTASSTAPGAPKDLNTVLTENYQSLGATPTGPGTGPTDLAYFAKRIQETGGMTPDNMAYWLGPNGRIAKELRGEVSPETAAATTPPNVSGSYSSSQYNAGSTTPTDFSQFMKTYGTEYTPSTYTPTKYDPGDLTPHDYSNVAAAPTYDYMGNAPDVANAFKAGSGGIVSNPGGISDALMAQLQARAGQSLVVDPTTDPVLRDQVNAARAEFLRGSRDTINDQAESGDPYATGALQAARVQAGERAGQQTAILQSQLAQNELNARRGEIQNALTQMGGLLTADQQLNLQRQLAQVNANLQKYQTQGNLSLQQQGVTNQNNQYYAGLSQQDKQFLKNLGLQYNQLNSGNEQYAAGLNQQDKQFAKNLGLNYDQLNSGNNQFFAGLSKQDQQFLKNLGLQYSQLNSQNDQFAANYGANATDRANYWDSVRRGLV